MVEADDLLQAQIREARVITGLEMIRRICNVRCLELDSQERVKELCRELQYHSIQSYFQDKVLEMMRMNIKDNTIYHICDAFQIHTILFIADNKRFFFGPYVEEPMTEQDAKNLRNSLGLRDLDVSDFLLYRGTFPTLSESRVRTIVSSFIHIIDPNSGGKMLRNLHYSIVEQDTTKSTTNNLTPVLVELRYSMERQFLNAISKGDKDTALSIQQKISQDINGLAQFGTTMANRRIGAAIVRTLSRIAAIQAGLPPVIIDHISNTSAKEVLDAQTPDQILASQDRMIRAFCRVIREAKSSQHSALVQVVLFTLENNYAQDISLPELAEEMCISENHLISTFKKEMNVTPNRYLTTIRMRHAAQMLIHGSKTVGDISTSVGIMDPNYFVKLFRKEYGETPSAYRKHYTV